MSAAAAPPARMLYRALLRELPPPARTRTWTRTPAQAFVRQAFQQRSGDGGGGGGGGGGGRAEKALQIGRYLKAQRTYAALLERYNPALARASRANPGAFGSGPFAPLA